MQSVSEIYLFLNEEAFFCLFEKFNKNIILKIQISCGIKVHNTKTSSSWEVGSRSKSRQSFVEIPFRIRLTDQCWKFRKINGGLGTE
jgi:hypothetical protein